MDITSWKNIILQWISECGFTERDFFNLDQYDINKFYINFSKKHHKISTDNYTKLLNFLQQFYPEFEASRDGDNRLSSEDCIYVYTLMLHFSCVKYPQTFFHDICQKLPTRSQEIMALFFREVCDIEKLNKENLRRALAEAFASHESLRSSDLISTSNSSLSTGTNPKNDSSLMTLECNNIETEGSSPFTPKIRLLEERTRELFTLRAELETERYEKDFLEVQIKRNEDKILKLHQDNKELLHQLQELNIDILTKANENNSLNREDDEHNKMHDRFANEIQQKDNEIMRLNETLRASQEHKIVAEEKLLYKNNQIEMCSQRIELLEMKINKLTEDIDKREETIKYLGDANAELKQCIAETIDANASVVADSTLSQNSKSFNDSTANEPETLAVSVVDKQLREKQHENIRMSKELHVLNENNTLLAEHIHDLLKLEMNEFHMTMDDLSESISEDDIQSNCDPIAQFNMFASCMDKINIHHQLERNKIETLKNEVVALQKQNLELTTTLKSVLDDANLLKSNLDVVKRKNKDLEETKDELQNSLRNCEAELKNLQEQLENSKTVKESSREVINVLKAKLHEIEKVNIELTGSNTQLKEHSEDLQSKLQNLQEKWMTQTKCLEEQVEGFSDQLQYQSKELKIFQNTELALRSKYEEMLIHNNRLKENSREATEHLNDMRHEVISKEIEMSDVGMQVSDLTMKNTDLEKSIDISMQEYKQEKQQLEKDQEKGLERIKELENEIFKLNEELVDLRVLLEDSKLESTNLKQTVVQLERKILALIELCSDNSMSNNSMSNNSVDNFEELEYHINSLIEQKNDLLKQVQAKQSIIDQCTYEELVVLKTQNMEYEDEIVKLKHKQNEFIEQIKSDSNKEESELRRQMKEAKLEHEQRLKELSKELKLAKEENNNKERELLLLIAEHRDMKSDLNDAEEQIRTLREFNDSIRINFERLKYFERRVMECFHDNEKLKLEFQNVHQEISKGLQYLINVSKSVRELTDEIKNKEMFDKAVLEYKQTLEEKEKQIEKFQERFNEQSQALASFNDRLIKMATEKRRLLKDSAAFMSQIQQEQEEKRILLSSLEKSADHMKASIQEEESRSENLERLNNEFKSEIESLHQHNAHLQDKLSESEADFKALSQDQQKLREDFQEKFSTLTQKLTESYGELEKHIAAHLDMAVIIENNVKLPEQTDEIKNVFNAHSSDSSESSTNQLRHLLNRLLHVHKLQQSKLEQLLQKENQTLNSKEELINEIQDLKSKLERNQKEMHDTHKKLENKDSIIQKRITNEVKHLEDKLLNLEKTNERINSERGTLQSRVIQQEQEIQSERLRFKEIADDKQQLTQQLRNMNEEMKKLQINLQEYQIVSERATTSCDILEKENQDKSSKLQNLEKELEEFKGKTQRTQSKLYLTQQQHNSLQIEHKKLLEKLKQEQGVLSSLEAELADKSEEILNRETKLIEMEDKQKELEKQITFTTKKLDEMVNCKLSAEMKCDQLRSDCQQYERGIKYLKSQHQNFADQNKRLCSGFDRVEADKIILSDEVKELKANLLYANENASKLMQQFETVRIEKEGVSQENQCLKKQLEEVVKRHASSEMKLKTFIERSQSLERHFLNYENELKNAKANFENSEVNLEKLTNEYRKVRESHQVTKKRIEKMILKLGDSQARSIKLEKDNEMLCKTLEANSVTVETLKKEKDLLQREISVLQERLLWAERGHEQMNAKIQNLEHINRTLQETKQKLEEVEIDDKMKINKLEKMRDANEEKVRKLISSQNSSEHLNVKLNLEIGALNMQLEKLNSDLSAEYNEQIEQIQRHLAMSQDQVQKYAQAKQNLTIRVNELQDQNAKINDQLSKLTLSINVSKDRCVKLSTERDQFHAELLVLQEGKAKAERELEIVKQSLKETRTRNEQIMSERNNLIESLESRIDVLVGQIKKMTKEVENLQNERKLLKEKAEIQSSELTESRNQTATTVVELEELSTRLSAMDAALKKEKQRSEQLRSDNQVLHSKYTEAKKQASEAEADAEEHIKANRLELEKTTKKMVNSKWNNRLYSCFKHFLAFVFTQTMFYVILNYLLDRNDSEMLF
uniref:Uncharacterized protein n=1 Tax=Glossina brevipalpis TaxID=37001 RepID=A0A1A9VZT8_9MUSC